MPILDKFSLKGKVALITAGAKEYGYGGCIVKALSEAGATTYFTSRKLENCGRLLDEQTEKGYDVKAAELELLDRKTIEDLYRKIIDEQGKIDILVNNAVLRPIKGYDDPIEDFELSMLANATNVFFLTRLFAQNMIERKQGSIINISSYAGLVGPDISMYEGTNMNGRADYYFHKGGMNQHTKYFASQLGRYNIRVNAICLGGLETGEWLQPNKFKKRYVKRTFLNRLANDDDVKGIVVFLASDASLYVTGTLIPVDGGYVAK